MSPSILNVFYSCSIVCVEINNISLYICLQWSFCLISLCDTQDTDPLKIVKDVGQCWRYLKSFEHLLKTI